MCRGRPAGHEWNTQPHKTNLRNNERMDQIERQFQEMRFDSWKLKWQSWAQNNNQGRNPTTKRINHNYFPQQMSFMTPHLHYWMPQQHIFPAYPTGPTLYPSTHHQTDRPQHNVFRTRGTRNSPHWHHSTSRQPHAIRKEQAPTQPSTTRSETSRDWRKRDPPTQPAPHYMTR